AAGGGGEEGGERDARGKVRKPIGDVARDRLVIVAGVETLVAVKPSRMVEEIPDRELGRDLLVHDGQVGDPRPHWLVQGQRALVDETPDDRGGVSLGEGAGLKKRGDRPPRPEAGEGGRGVPPAGPGRRADAAAGNRCRPRR